MKILILVDHCISSPPISLENCKNRFQLYAYMLYKYIKDDTILFKNLNIHNDDIINQNIDHIIIIGEKAYKPEYKKNIKGIVVTLNVSNITYQGEDILFYMDNCCNNRNNTTLLNWLNDPEELYPIKDDKINVIIQKPNKECQLYEKIINTMTKVKNKHHNIKLGILSNNYYKDLSSNSITILDNYKTRFDIIKSTNVYIITSDMFDRELLYNFAFCNTLIVTNDIFINPKILNDIDCIFYENEISWKNIINGLKHVNSRHRLMEYKTAINAITKMTQFLEPFDDTETTETENDIIIHKIKRTKCLTLLQSDLRLLR